ncbi:src-like-adapter 2 isoform X1 [Falco naumanni]|uniref:src-like-adapter 2 isoform X1 n=1 Tax=Falco naumanni TaxID=148594 RepID=UPI001ADEAE9C|nr:src-like-adapter 2 isoform X1 [Falco naumanni]
MAHPPYLQGWGVVAGGVRGVWQGVPHPQQLRGQDQVQASDGKGLSQDRPQRTRPYHREPGQLQGQTLAPVPAQRAPFLSLGCGAVLGLGEAAQQLCTATPRAALSAPGGAGQALGHCWVSLHSQERLCQRLLSAPRRWLYEGISRQKAEELLLQPSNRSGSFLIRESQTRQGCYSLSVRRSERASWDSVTHYRIHRLENGWVYISPGLTFPSLHDLVDHYSGNTLPLPSTLSWGGAVGGNTLRLTGREGGKVAATPHLPRCPHGWGTGQGGTLLTLPPPCPEFGEGLCCALGEPCSMEGARAAPVPAMPAVVKKPSLNWDKIDSSLLFSEATAPLEDDSPISLGLREAISSYLLVTETGPCREGKNS